MLTAYFAQTGAIRADAALAAVYACALSLAQRRLSTPVRDLRRHAVSVEGRIDRRDGSSEPVTRRMLTSAPESALRLLALASVTLAAGLLIMRLA